MVTLKRIVFFIFSTIILTLFVWWGFDGFQLFTKIYPPTELIDEKTGRVVVITQGSFKLGLDIVLVISVGLVALGFIIINFFSIWSSRKKNY